MPLFVAIAGGSGAGKSTLARSLAEAWGAAQLDLDHYYLANERRPEWLGLNYDRPENIDWPLLAEQLGALRAGETVLRPTYDYWNGHTRPTAMGPCQKVVFEGFLALHDPRVRSFFDAAIYLDGDAEEHLRRRIPRDLALRGVSEERTRAMWAQNAAPVHAEFVEPQKALADLVLSSKESPELLLGRALAFVQRIERGQAQKPVRRGPMA
jgi:uridine kinase